MERPIINRRFGGEYSTITLPDGCVETMWFGDDGSSRMVGRSYPLSVKEIAARHIAADETD